MRSKAERVHGVRLAITWLNGADRMADAQDDVWLGPRERGQRPRESAMRAYLAWEIDLVNQMATDDDQRFNVVKV